MTNIVRVNRDLFMVHSVFISGRWWMIMEYAVQLLSYNSGGGFGRSLFREDAAAHDNNNNDKDH